MWSVGGREVGGNSPEVGEKWWGNGQGEVIHIPESGGETAQKWGEITRKSRGMAAEGGELASKWVGEQSYTAQKWGGKALKNRLEMAPK